MNFDALLQKYHNLLKETQELKAELQKYRSRFGLLDDAGEKISRKTDHIPPEIQSPRSNQINKFSSPETKIEIFLSLFKGRQDVYAKRWQNQSGKSGYSPVCLNEWDQTYCKKPQIKCAACEHQNYDKWGAEAVDQHLRGDAVFGVYPLLNDETCHFLVIDFDGQDWQADVTTIRKICLENNIPVAIERSRSGNGAHAWFFYSEAIHAATARKFGTALLTQAMNHRHQIQFKSYDRLFPNQDTVPKGGYGNLIALPLQKQAREQGNSVFIDENFRPFKDQWHFLSSVHHFSESELHSHLRRLVRGNELGDLRQEEVEESKPWIERKKISHLSQKDVPDKVLITKANMLYIPTRDFSERALNAIKRLAAFKNPDFYKAQAIRLPTWNKPRIISLADASPGFLHLPRGCEETLIELLSQTKTEISWLDERVHQPEIEVEFKGQLREQQIAAASALLNYETGVLAASTAFGKTVVVAKLIAERKANTLVLVHTRQLLEQWHSRLLQFLQIRTPVQSEKKKSKAKSPIGQIGGGKNKPGGVIDVAIMQSLVRGDEVKEVVRNYGMVIVDECHHVPAFSFEQILRKVRAKYVYGLTATPARQDGHHPIIFMQCGPIRHTVDARDQAEKRPFSHFVIPRFTAFKKPFKSDEKSLTIGELYSELGVDAARNQLIINDAVQSVKDGRHPIILTQRTAHVESLARALRKVLPTVIALTGSMPAKARKEALQSLMRLSAKSQAVIVATGKFVGEGFDEPRLDTLLLAMPIAWKGTVQQYAGRLHRLFQGKSEVQIFDYVDVHVAVLERMYQKRLRGYAAIGYSVKGDAKAIESISSIFDNNSFFPVFERDVQNTQREIVIVSPFLRKNRLVFMMGLLKATKERGVEITIATRPESDFQAHNRIAQKEKLAYLQSTGVKLTPKSRVH
ncbi:MAG: helicase, partial [Calditrichaeota bacterium]